MDAMFTKALDKVKGAGNERVTAQLKDALLQVAQHLVRLVGENMVLPRGYEVQVLHSLDHTNKAFLVLKSSKQHFGPSLQPVWNEEGLVLPAGADEFRQLAQAVQNGWLEEVIAMLGKVYTAKLKSLVLLKGLKLPEAPKIPQRRKEDKVREKQEWQEISLEALVASIEGH